MLIGYFDDSGTHTNSEIVVMAGFVGTREQWQQFKKAWSDKLSEPLPGKPPLKRFHMVNCVQRDREFSDYTEAERDAVIHDFRQIILDAKLIGNVTAVDRVAWDEIMVGPLRMLHGDAEWYCLNSCMGFADILVVSPYNMQVNLLRTRLPEGAQVGTVDKFQGQEAAVVLISMVTSSGDDLTRQRRGHQRSGRRPQRGVHRSGLSEYRCHAPCARHQGHGRDHDLGPGHAQSRRGLEPRLYRGRRQRPSGRRQSNDSQHLYPDLRAL